MEGAKAEQPAKRQAISRANAGAVQRTDARREGMRLAVNVFLTGWFTA
jgi:hypothetical protein